MEWPVRWTKQWQSVPLSGRECWLRWEDGTTDGPFPALALLICTDSIEVTTESERHSRENKDGKLFTWREYRSPPELDASELEEGHQYLTKAVVLGVPGGWDENTFVIGDDKPQVWWTEPPPLPAPDEAEAQS